MAPAEIYTVARRLARYRWLWIICQQHLSISLIHTTSSHLVVVQYQTIGKSTINTVTMPIVNITAVNYHSTLLRSPKILITCCSKHPIQSPQHPLLFHHNNLVFHTCRTIFTRRLAAITDTAQHTVTAHQSFYIKSNLYRRVVYLQWHTSRRTLHINPIPHYHQTISIW